MNVVMAVVGSTQAFFMLIKMLGTFDNIQLLWSWVLILLLLPLLLPVLLC